MAWNKPIDEVELAYIEKWWPSRSAGEIAERLGRSKRGVENAINRLGLRESHARASDPAASGAREPGAGGPGGAGPAPGAAGGEGPQDELAELRDLRRMLKRTMHEDAGPQSMPRLAAEFRETVKRISELEGGGDGAGDGGGQGSIVVSVPLRPA